mmetsp:Transcript_4049/g.3947  ORF Transcript_4049/g.3947 Transcript_4049/m.3947 type:complete len:171 (+) Transcript_4049:1-513(+)
MNTAKSSSQGAKQKVGSVNNDLDQKKRKYIIEMRKSLIDNDIVFSDGSLNLKYFNVKKGQYWSKRETETLIKGVIQYGPTSIKQIKECYFKNWTETEIRLRICRLLKYYNLADYQEHSFSCPQEIFEEAAKNKEKATAAKKAVGGIFYNPPPETNEEILGNFFKKKGGVQ